MPGRAFIGLGRDRHPGEFGTPPLPEGPSIGRVRLIIGATAGLFVLWIGYIARHSFDCKHIAQCPPAPGSQHSVVWWTCFGLLVAAVVIGWPYFAYAFRRLIGRPARTS